MSTESIVLQMREAHQKVTGEKWCYLCMRWRKLASAFTKKLRCCDECNTKRKRR